MCFLEAPFARSCDHTRWFRVTAGESKLVGPRFLYLHSANSLAFCQGSQFNSVARYWHTSLPAAIFGQGSLNLASLDLDNLTFLWTLKVNLFLDDPCLSTGACSLDICDWRGI